MSQMKEPRVREHAEVAAPEHSVEPVAGLDDLADAFLAMRTRDEARRFLRDLCTLPELEALTHRWQIAQLVDRGVSYLEIAQRVPTSTATVTRVAQWVRHGSGGYRMALERTSGSSSKGRSGS
jgi:TrpR-related protein YerC/YecD